jgi:hypothetical protein
MWLHLPEKEYLYNREIEPGRDFAYFSSYITKYASHLLDSDVMPLCYSDLMSILATEVHVAVSSR